MSTMSTTGRDRITDDSTHRESLSRGRLQHSSRHRTLGRQSRHNVHEKQKARGKQWTLSLLDETVVTVTMTTVETTRSAVTDIPNIERVTRTAEMTESLGSAHAAELRAGSLEETEQRTTSRGLTYRVPRTSSGSQMPLAEVVDSQAEMKVERRSQRHRHAVSIWQAEEPEDLSDLSVWLESPGIPELVGRRLREDLTPEDDAFVPLGKVQITWEPGRVLPTVGQSVTEEV